MRIDPDNDPNEAYEIGNPPVPGPPQDWFGIYCNGVYVGSNASREFAERYISDPALRAEIQRTNDEKWKVGHPGETQRR